MTDNNVFRVPKPEKLLENETITGFASWKQNMRYNLSLNNNFAPFLEPAFVWLKKSVANRGLTSDNDDIAENRRKTAAQKMHSIGTYDWLYSTIQSIIAVQ